MVGDSGCSFTDVPVFKSVAFGGTVSDMVPVFRCRDRHSAEIHRVAVGSATTSPNGLSIISVTPRCLAGRQQENHRRVGISRRRHRCIHGAHEPASVSHAAWVPDRAGTKGGFLPLQQIKAMCSKVKLQVSKV